MIIRVFILCFLTFPLMAIDLSPLPDSFFKSIHVVPFYGVNHFKSFDISNDGGQLKPIHETLGVRVAWHHPLKGWSFQYQFLNGYVTSQPSLTLTETKLLLDIMKIRYSIMVIDDEIGTMSVYGSWGQVGGRYDIIGSIETGGVNRYIVRSLSAYVADVGVTFGYALNPGWRFLIEAAYQLSYDEQVTTMGGGTHSGVTIDFSGPMIHLGTSFQL
jgi:hypothetical protein